MILFSGYFTDQGTVFIFEVNLGQNMGEEAVKELKVDIGSRNSSFTCFGCTTCLKFLCFRFFLIFPKMRVAT